MYLSTQKRTFCFLEKNTVYIYKNSFSLNFQKYEKMNCLLIHQSYLKNFAKTLEVELSLIQASKHEGYSLEVILALM